MFVKMAEKFCIFQETKTTFFCIQFSFLVQLIDLLMLKYMLPFMLPFGIWYTN